MFPYVCIRPIYYVVSYDHVHIVWNMDNTPEFYFSDIVLYTSQDNRSVNIPIMYVFAIVILALYV